MNTSKKNYEIVTEHILEMIKNKILQPGDKLESVEKLAIKYNVGRSTVREALSALRAMGIVEVRQGDGTYIANINESNLRLPLSSSILSNTKELADLLTVRKIIESSAASISALTRTDKDLEKMRIALEQMKQAIHNEELGEEADLSFHLAIAEATQNNLLIYLINQITGLMRSQMKETRRIWFFGDKSSVKRLYHQHLSIYEAIVDQNPNLAQELMLSHLYKVENVLIQYDKNLHKEISKISKHTNKFILQKEEPW
jgi:GntR family transcriptional repressor for pyruvate dehydrogenase complex